MLKEIKYFLLLNILPPVIYAIITFIRLTSRIEHINRSKVDESWQRGENFIICFWHGRLLMMPFANIRGKGKVLISRHRDGEFIARVIRFFGLDAIRGSYRKKTVSSVREIMSSIRHGFDVAITPDGPKGPRYKVKKGIIELARITKAGIVPVTYSAGKKKTFKSWDRFVLPLPFSRIVFLWGEPIYINKDMDEEAMEDMRLHLENKLIELTEEADRIACGR
ncbi:MAG: lysophospholipid acyltransferase family protein [Syntrophorhabdaceae bacterium]|nr:lysophospholipid acyltransferase family protein [Syntrophorhabdaceae bacterium]